MLGSSGAEYGSTPVTPEERHAFALGFDASLKAEVDQAEVDALAEVFDDVAVQVIEGLLDPEELCRPEFVIGLHQRALAGIWAWAGKIRNRDLSIGMDKGLVNYELGKLMDDLREWLANEWFSNHELALRVHHRLVWVHPFVDVNGRLARLYADLLLVYLTGNPTLVIEWEPARAYKAQYIAALRHADAAAGDVTLLMDMLPTRVLTARA